MTKKELIDALAERTGLSKVAAQKSVDALADLATEALATGNTVVDALLMTLDAVRKNPPALPARVEEAIAQKREIILVTGHRRESFGQGVRNICEGLHRIAKQAKCQLLSSVILLCQGQ